MDMARKNPHAVALGRLGGSKGGKARAENLSPEELSEIGRKGGTVGGKARAEALTAKQRSAIASKAAAARWKDKAPKEANQPASTPVKKARKK
jgi:general stress protein YciG